MSAGAYRMIVSLAVAPLAALVAAGGAAPAAGAAVASKPSGIAYVANEATGTVSRINTATNRTERPVHLGARSVPSAIVVTPNGRTAYVASYFTGVVTPISTRTGKPGKPIKVPRYPDGLAVAPNGKTVYVTSEINQNDQVRGRLTAISTTTNTASKPLRVGLDPGPMLISANSKTVYVATFGWDSQRGYGNVTVIRRGKVRRLVWLVAFPDDMVLSPDGRTLWVANEPDSAPGCSGSAARPARTAAPLARSRPVRSARDRSYGQLCAQLVPISTATNLKGQPIPIDGQPYQAVMPPRGGEIYVLTYGGTVQAINTGTRKISWTADPVDAAALAAALAVTPGGRALYALDGNSTSRPGWVTPIHPATGQVGARIDVGADPVTMAFTPGGQTGYVLCAPMWSDGNREKFGIGTVVPISTATNKAGRPIKVGRGPVAIAIGR